MTSYAVMGIVSRRHVAEGYLSVVRYVLSRLKGGRKAFFAGDKESRRELIKHILKTHQYNRSIYIRVMGGL